MSNKVKEIDIKKQTYYFFDDIINIKNFDANNVKIDEKSYKNILIYYTILDVWRSKIQNNSVNPLHLIFKKVTEYFEDVNENKYLTLVPTNESKEKI